MGDPPEGGSEPPRSRRTFRLPAHCLIATGVDAAVHREILGVDVASSEDGAGRLALPCRLSGVALVISDDRFAPGPAWGRNSQLVADLAQQAVPALHVGIGLHADRR